MRIFAGLLSLVLTLSTWADPPAGETRSRVPGADRVRNLSPEVRGRLGVYDQVNRQTAAAAGEVQSRYSDEAALDDLEARLRRSEVSGNPRDILTPEEWAQYEKNVAELRQIEEGIVQSRRIRLPQRVGLAAQNVFTRVMSPAPTGRKKEELIAHWRKQRQENPLYRMWNEPVPGDRFGGKWGDLLEGFHSSESFRTRWLADNQDKPEMLKQMRELSQALAKEDISIEEVRIEGRGTPRENWILKRDPKSKAPNRFRTLLEERYDDLVKLEFAPTLHFNRLSSMDVENGVDVFRFTPVEKGRTMEKVTPQTAGAPDNRLYRGAELPRMTKVDEVSQLDNVVAGELGLYRPGLRTMPLGEAMNLMREYPTLMRAVGAFGFSVTGGPAQMISVRTDGVQQQAPKLAATLRDIVDFAQTKDVKAWVQQNNRFLARTIVGGVGSGGHFDVTQKPAAPGPASLTPAVDCDGYYSKLK